MFIPNLLVIKKTNLTTSILSSDASDFLALALALAVIDNTAVVTCKGTRTITHCTFSQIVSSRSQGKTFYARIHVQQSTINYFLVAGF